MRLKTRLIYFAAFSIFLYFNLSFAEIADYCAIPPFISRAMKPNVMLIVDNSGSMFRFAYFDGWDTADASDDNWCTSASDPCDDFNPNYNYYGYFDPNYWYAYGSNRFYPTAPKASRGKRSGEWDGNFLNWLTMRRVDIVRKVLTGGRVVAEGGEKRLVAEPPDWWGRGVYKRVYGAERYTPYRGTVNFTVYGTTGTARIKVYSDRYDVKVALGDTTPQGIIQRVGSKVRWGLSFFHQNTQSPQGGYVEASIEERDGASLESIVNAINNKRPDSNTPLAETLWTVTGYFAQEARMLGGPGPMYQSGDYQINDNVDPYNYGTGGQSLMAWCAKSFVILITDGEPCADGYLPDELKDYANGRSDFNCSRRSSDPSDPCYIPSCYYGGYVPGIEDVALWAHTNDLREDLDHEQNLTLYTVFAFGAGSELLKYAAINGGFVDKNDNGKPDLQEEWDADGDGVPDNYFTALGGYELEEALMGAITDILKRTSSGTSVSVLSEEAGGAVLLQAVFCPQRSFFEGADLYTLNWIGHLYNWWIYRGFEAEKVNIREDTIEDKELKLKEDYVIQFVFEDNQLKIKAYKDKDGDGAPDDPDNATVTYSSLDQAYDVWEAGEKLKDTGASLRTIYTNVGGEMIAFSKENWWQIDDYLGSEYSGDETAAKALIDYIRGEDIDGFRSRSIGSSVWKLGDIIYSTPQVVTYYDYSVVYVGGNDGMLHAFKIGYLDTAVEGAVARLQNSRGDTGYEELGEELWAFIPKNSLPYLRYYADPDYPHLYYVDLSPFVIEVDYDRDGTVEKVLIGGMRLGAAVGCSGTDCVNPPSDTCPDPSDLDNCTGLSSYFALDISDPEAPQLMWEFTHPDLGFSYSGPAVVKKEDNYYAVFLSGPTNYSGRSEQDLKVFVVNLEDGNLVTTIDSGKTKAFGGRLFTYSKAGPIYFGYTQEGSWKGGVLRLDTSDSDPRNWTISSVVEDIGPVTVSIKREIFGGNEWLYFGEGRYFVKDDDPSTVRYLYGVRPELCQDRGYCNRDDLGDVTELTGSPTTYGWYIELDPQDGNWAAERLITDPTVYKRSQTSGEVYFVTLQPNTHPCEFGGRSYIWRVEATTGGPVTEAMPGVLLVQLSTGQIVEAKEGGRKSGPFTGVPGEQSPSLLRPLHGWTGTIIQWIER